MTHRRHDAPVPPRRPPPSQQQPSPEQQPSQQPSSRPPSDPGTPTGAPPTTDVRPAVAVRPLEPADVGELLTVQRAAFASEALLYSDPALPAMVQTLDELRRDLVGDIALKAVWGTRLVGGVRGRLDDGVLHVARLVVAPDLQGLGVGSALLAALEARPDHRARTAVLFTGDRSAGNLALYARRGYRETSREPGPTGIVRVHLAKALPAR